MRVFAVIAICIVSALAKPNGYAHYGHPDIRIESYTMAPPPATAAPTPAADTPMHTGYNYHAHQPTFVVADTPKVEYGYQSPPPADVPKPSHDYGYGSHGATLIRTNVPTIVRQLVQSDNAGTYNMHVESSDGSSHAETGSLKNLGHPEGPTSVKEGSYSFTSPEGLRFTVTYTADERGFIAHGAHLPTSPPMPEEIRKSLALPRVHDAYTPMVSSPPMSTYGYAAPPQSDISAIRVAASNGYY